MPVTVVVRSASAPSPRGPGGSARGQEDDPSLTFDGARVVLGRGPGSDVRLPDPSVSTRHATIRAQGNDYAIVDEGSTNGTWVGGVKLLPQSPRVVKTGDLVRIGRVWLELSVGQKAPTPDLGLATRDLAFALVQRAMDALGDDTVAKVRVAEGPDIGEELRLVEEGRAYVIGRSETCDLPLADADSSREHAVVARRGGQILLRDLGSRNGVFLGDQRLTPDRDVVWRAPTMARIGLTVLALDEPVSLALAELEAAEDEAMREDDVPPLPASSAPPAPPAAPSPPSKVSRAPTPADESPPSRMSQAAPIAEIAPDTTEMPRVARGKRGWTMTDFLVVTLALAVIGASIAGLVWVLR
ncbi:MAG TPA: FHA domain-containing protein [Labilithrix sp.]|nr:FHA domain-containing protein [Labilithrix sp.]